MAEPEVNTMRTARISSIRIMGASQNFFRSRKNIHKSFRSSIGRLPGASCAPVTPYYSASSRRPSIMHKKAAPPLRGGAGKTVVFDRDAYPVVATRPPKWKKSILIQPPELVIRRNGFEGIFP